MVGTRNTALTYTSFDVCPPGETFLEFGGEFLLIMLITYNAEVLSFIPNHFSIVSSWECGTLSSTEKHYWCQGHIQPVSLGGDFSYIW